jgi:hypothetical protein
MIVGIVGEVSRHMTIWGNFIFAGMEGVFQEREERYFLFVCKTI